VTHVDDAVLASVRARLGTPVELPWEGEISEQEWAVATHNPTRTHDVTLFILDPSRRLALIRKPPFAPGVWRPPGGGVEPGEDFVAGAVREALEETGLRVELRRYLVASRALFRCGGRELAWRTHVVLAETEDEELAPDDPAEIAAARWGTLEELAGPLRERLLATGRAFWRYRVALHDAALVAMARETPVSDTPRPQGVGHSGSEV
jgi:ADP-ribose pyrophosphatase YjhB (NUDIX family)